MKKMDHLKKILCFAAAVALMAGAGCSRSDTGRTDETKAETASVTAVETAAENNNNEAESAASVISIKINTEGMGQIAAAESGEELEFNEDYPTQSAQYNLDKPTDYSIAAKADEGWYFVKWTKDGEDFSEEVSLDLTFSESGDYVAVFAVDE